MKLTIVKIHPFVPCKRLAVLEERSQTIIALFNDEASAGHYIEGFNRAVEMTSTPGAESVTHYGRHETQE